MRLIDESRAIDEINEWLDCVGTATIGKGILYYHELIGCIEETPTAQAWIPVNERLPTEEECNKNKLTEQYREFECTVDSFGILYTRRLFLKDNTQWVAGSASGIIDFTPNVTAWQPLPEPYRG